MPLVRKLDANLWEIRTSLPSRIVRVLFTVEDHVIILLHGFVKKTASTPMTDLSLAKRRMK